MNAGQATIDWLYREQLRVDDEWSLRDAKGFTWWADQNAQRIEILRSDNPPDLGESFVIRVRTEMIHDLDLNDEVLTGLNTILMPYASMCGPVYDPETKCLSLSSLVRVHDGIREWMSRLISMAAVLQVGEARIMGPELAKLFGGRFAVSAHPENGLRPEPDEMAEIIATVVGPAGRNSPAWRDREFNEAVKSCMMQLPSLGATSGGPGLTVEFPFGESSSLCVMKADEPHPRYGNGLHVRQSFQIDVADALAGSALALELNAEELNRDPAGYGFGSFCYRSGVMHFCTFLPNLVYTQRLLENLYFASAARARRMSERFCGDDWSTLSLRGHRALDQSVFGRLARKFSRIWS